MLDVCVSNVCNPVKHIGLRCSCVLSVMCVIQLNTLGWGAVVSYPCKLILLLSAVVCLVRTAYKFEFRQDIN